MNMAEMVFEISQNYFNQISNERCIRSETKKTYALIIQLNMAFFYQFVSVIILFL